MILAVLLNILKWIGIILLCIVGLILFLILMVCFCPFTYNISAYGDIKDAKSIKAIAKFGWFLWIIRPVIIYENEKIKVIVRIFGIPINLTKEKKKRKKGSERNTDNNKIEVYEPLSYNESVDKTKDIDFEELFEESFEEEKPKIELKKAAEEKVDINSEEKAEKKAKKKFRRKPSKEISQEEKLKLKEEQARLKAEKKKDRQDKLKKLKEAYETFKKQETKEAINLVKGIVIKTFRHVMPRRYKGHVNYGFEDPCTTGQVLAGIAAIYPVFKGKLSVVPYFDTNDMILNGNIYVRGRIVIIFFLAQAVKIWKNKTIRELIKKAR